MILLVAEPHLFYLISARNGIHASESGLSLFRSSPGAKQKDLEFILKSAPTIFALSTRYSPYQERKIQAQ